MTSNVFMVMIVFLLSGGRNTDVVSFLPPRDYFQSRKIAISIDKMFELAAKAPENPKEAVQQLLALRVLSEDIGDLKFSADAKKVRMLFERLAEGKSDHDPAGFAKLYARRALAQLDGKKPPAEHRPTREQALAWLPEKAEILAMFQSFDNEPLAKEPGAPLLVRRFLSQQEREALFDDVEQLGNLQLDRVAVAFGNKTDFLVFSGKFHQPYLRKALEKFGLKFEEHPQIGGAPVLIGKNKEIGVVCVGNTEVILLDVKQIETKDLLDEILARPTRKSHKEVVAKRFRDVPANAWAFCIGEFKDGDDLYKINFHALRSAAGLHFEALATFPTERQAEEMETTLRKGISEFKESMPNLLLVIGLDRMRKDGLKENSPDLDGKAVLASFDKIKTSVKNNKVVFVADFPEETWVCAAWTVREYLTAVDRLLGPRNKNTKPLADPSPPAFPP